MVLRHGDQHGHAAHHARARLVHRERRDAEQDLFAGRHERPDDQVDDLGRSRAEHDVVGAEALAAAELRAEVLAAGRVEMPLGRRVDDRAKHALARGERVLVGHHAQETVTRRGLLEVVFLVGLRGTHPGRREELHRVRIDRAVARRLVAEIVAEHAHHRLGALEGLRRIDVDPAGVAGVAAEEETAAGEGVHAAGQADVAGGAVDAVELLDERRTDAEHAGVDRVVLGQLLADVDDATLRHAHLGGVVDVEAAIDVVVDRERAAAGRQVEAPQTTDDLRRVHVVGHRQDALLIDELARREERHTVSLGVVGVLHELELEAEVRLDEQRLLDGVCAVTDDDDRLPDALRLQGAEDPHEHRDAADRLQGLGVLLVRHQA